MNITGSKSKEDYKAIKEGRHLSYEPDIYYHIGIAYCNLEKFVDAVYPFSKAIEMVGDSVMYVHERAKAYQMIEEHQSAIEDFDKVIGRVWIDWCGRERILLFDEFLHHVER